MLSTSEHLLISDSGKDSWTETSITGEQRRHSLHLNRNQLLALQWELCAANSNKFVFL